ALVIGLLFLGLVLDGYKLFPRWYNARELAAVSDRDVYDETANPHQQLDAALGRAKRQHKRVLVVLGGDWCQWCLTLDNLFESDSELHQLTTVAFVLLKLDADTASELDER